MGDPQEGLDAAGYLTTGARRANLHSPFTAVVDDGVAACTRLRGFRSLAVYGSVATGQAREAQSDLDLLLVADDAVDRGEVAATAAALSDRHAAVVREVSIAVATLAEVHARDDRSYPDRVDGLRVGVCLLR